MNMLVVHHLTWTIKSLISKKTFWCLEIFHIISNISFSSFVVYTERSLMKFTVMRECFDENSYNMDSSPEG